KRAFGLLVVASGVQIAAGGVRPSERQLRARSPATAVPGADPRLCTATSGAAGGVAASTRTLAMVGRDLQSREVRSRSIRAVASPAGTATYISVGLGVEGLPPGSLGYVHVWAALPLVAGSLLAVSWGVRVNRRLPVRKLRWVFAVVFIMIGMRLVVQNASVVL